jgi:hypothetical protein
VTARGNDGNAKPRHFPVNSFTSGAGMDRDVPRLVVGVDEVADEAVAIAVEVDAHEFAGAVQDGRAGIAADGVRRRDEVEGRSEVELVLAGKPARGEVERLLAAERGVPLEDLREVGVER